MKHHSWLCKSTVWMLQAVFAMTVVLSPAYLHAQPPGNGWKLVFEDNFNGTQIDTKKWNTCYWWESDGGCTNGGNKELQWYQKDDVLVKNGTVRLRAQKRKMNEFNYTSGMISSHDKFAFKYGYATIRAKMPKGKGFWPTFWLIPQKRNVWPPEIDIVEYLGAQPRRVYMNVHYGTGDNHKYDISHWDGSDYSQNFHTFAAEWSPDQMIWYVDGIERKRFKDVLNIPSQPMYLLAALPIGAAWINTPPDDTTPFPSYMEIDYIKVWQRK